MFGKTFEMAQELFSSLPIINDEQVDALAGACFEVDRVPLVTPNGTVSKDHSFLYRPDTDAILGTVGNRYEVVDNVDVLVPAMNSILNSGLDLTDLKVNVVWGMVALPRLLLLTCRRTLSKWDVRSATSVAWLLRS